MCAGSSGIGSFTVLDSAGGRNNKMADVLGVFCALLRLLESDGFKSDVSKISLSSFYGIFQTWVLQTKPEVSELGGQPVERFTELLPVLKDKLGNNTKITPVSNGTTSVARLSV